MLLLCIDDDPDDMELLCEGIRSVYPSYICVSAKNGEEALNLLKTIVPDIIFLDINMPLMDGRETLREIRKRKSFKHIPVYILSTTTNRDEMQQFKLLGAEAFITKPNSFQELCSILKGLLIQSV